MEEIRQFDAGSWFHPLFSKQHIPTLDEVFQSVGSKLWVDVEIKSDWLHHEPPGLLEEKVLDTVHRCGMDKYVMFSSFDHRLLANIKRMKPSAITGVLYNFSHDFCHLPSRLTECVGASVFVCAKRELTHRMVDDAHHHDIAVYVYTLNSVHDAQRMLTYCVDGIISNNADDILGVVKNNGVRVESFC
jgi:glycerophosphoryl diester phosphodiesterase